MHLFPHDKFSSGTVLVYGRVDWRVRPGDRAPRWVRVGQKLFVKFVTMKLFCDCAVRPTLLDRPGVGYGRFSAIPKRYWDSNFQAISARYSHDLIQKNIRMESPENLSSVAETCFALRLRCAL